MRKSCLKGAWKIKTAGRKLKVAQRYYNRTILPGKFSRAQNGRESKAYSYCRFHRHAFYGGQSVRASYKHSVYGFKLRDFAHTALAYGKKLKADNSACDFHGGAESPVRQNGQRAF
jgi:hypothetical protein